MNLTWSQSAWSFALACLVAAGTSSTAQAQHRHHGHRSSDRAGVHHHHDAAGHRVDDAGHHIDRLGRHTGPVGVYDNGARDYRNLNGGWGYGGYNRYGYGSGYGYGSRYGYGAGYGSGYGVGISVTPSYVPVVPSTGYLPPSTYVPGGAYGVPLGSTAVGNPVYADRPPQNSLPGSGGNFAGGEIRLLNPADSGGDVRYNLNGTEYTIRQGYAQTVAADRVWTISFGSGGSLGDLRYTLSPGEYAFRPTSQGWDLKQVTTVTSGPAPVVNNPGPVIDNSRTVIIAPAQ